MEIPTPDKLGEMLNLTAEEYALLKRIYKRELNKCGITEEEMPPYPNPIYSESTFLLDMAFKAEKRLEEECDGTIWIGEYNTKFDQTNNTSIDQVMEYNRSAILDGRDDGWTAVYESRLHWEVSLFLCIFREIMKEKELIMRQEEQ